MIVRYNLDNLRLRAYVLLCDEQAKQGVTLLNATTDLGFDSPAHRVLEAIRLKERQLQQVGDNLEGAMELRRGAKEGTQEFSNILADAPTKTIL